VATLALLWGAAGAARADFIVTTTLSGSEETPPNSSPATGSITVTFLSAQPNQLMIHEVFSGLVAPNTAAHIHVGPPGVAGPIVLPFTGFPTGVTSGTYDAVLTDADLTPGGGINTFADLIAAIEAGDTYANIHSTMFPGGEIRGQLPPSPAVPEPASFTLAGLGALGLIAARWRKRRV
jgi:hypothetical protein